MTNKAEEIKDNAVERKGMGRIELPQPVKRSKKKSAAESIQAWRDCLPAHSSRSAKIARAASAAQISGEFRITAAKAAIG